jgi:hypothetical protein
MMALGHLPALFALPAGLGDIAAGIAAPLVAYRLARGTGRRAARWHNAFGMTDLVVALTLGGLTGFQLLNVTPSAAPIFELPLALIVTAGVPLLLVLHITSMSALAKAPRTPLPVTGPLIAGATPRTGVAETRQPVPGEALSAEKKTVHRKIDALKGSGPARRRTAHHRRAHQPAHGRPALPGRPCARETVRRAWARSTERKRNEHPESIPRRRDPGDLPAQVRP